MNLSFGTSLVNRVMRPQVVALFSLCAAGTSSAVIYSEDFSTDPSASWTVNDPGLSDILADFHYDYSAIGVPTAPGGADSRGLKMTANNSGSVFSGFSVSPSGLIVTGEYRLTFDLWQNYVGPLGPGGSGSTQLSTFGVETAGDVAFWAGAPTKESVAFAVSLDGGSTNDYRAYSSDAPTAYASGNAVYSATSTNDSNAYYTAAFAATAAPAAQVALFPGQTGATNAGEIAFAWRTVEIEVIGGNATWYIDGLEIASVPLAGLTLGGGNIFFGHSDTNAGSSTDPNDSTLNVTIIDNIRVVAIPEPSSALFLAVGGLVFLGRCGRSSRG